MTSGRPEITWSKDANVDADGKRYSAFMLTTWAVRAVWRDGTTKVRLLPPGEQGRHPRPEDDREWASAVEAELEAQDDPVVIEAG
jgi:hypothetical protein